MAKSDFSHRFHIIPRDLLKEQLLLGDKPGVPEGSLTLAASTPVTFSQDPEVSDNGTVWRQTFGAVVDDPSVMEHSGSRAYIAFYMTDGSLRLIGTAEEAPLVTVTPHAGAQRVSITFDSPDPLIL